MTERGILYFAKGDEYVSEAKRSAERAHKLMGYPITLVTNKQVDAGFFDNIIIDNSEFKKSDKPKILLKSPYEETIFLDTDIWIEQPVDELYSILDQFELAMVKDPKEPHVYYKNRSHPINGVPKSFPEYNTGVLVYKKTPDIMQLLKQWERRCGPNADRDQLSFRTSLYHSDVRYTSLRPEYNCMYRAHNAMNGPVKIFHGKLEEKLDAISVEDAVETINRNQDHRVSYGYSPYVETIPPRSSIVYIRSKLTYLWVIIRNEGAVEATKQLTKYLGRKLQIKP
jgi:hypothetical protein